MGGSITMSPCHFAHDYPRIIPPIIHHVCYFCCLFNPNLLHFWLVRSQLVLHIFFIMVVKSTIIHHFGWLHPLLNPNCSSIFGGLVKSPLFLHTFGWFKLTPNFSSCLVTLWQTNIAIENGHL